MSLESKAKTTKNIYNISKQVEKDLETQFCDEFTQGSIQRQKWVPLEEVQKEIEQIKTDEDKHAQTLVEQRDKAEQTLEGIKETLNKLIANAQTMNYYIKQPDIRYTQRTQKWLSEYDLKSLLEALK